MAYRKDIDPRTQKRMAKRKQRSAMNLDDDKFYKKELKGLTPMQKAKMMRKRNKLLAKEQKKKDLKRDLDSKNPESKDNPLLREPQINGKPSVRKKKTKKSKFRGVSNPNINDNDNSGNIDSQDLNFRTKLIGKIKKLKKKNKSKKDKKRRKFMTFILSVPFAIPIILFLTTIFSIMLIVIASSVASFALSHSSGILELYNAGFLGDAIGLANVKDDVENDDGEVIAKGNSDAQPGEFDWYGVYDNGSGKTTKPKDDTEEESDSGGSSGSVPTDKKAFLAMDISNDFGVDEDKMIAYFIKNSIKAKTRLGGNADNVKKLMKIVKANGMSPELFIAYEIQEQGDYWGWLNHTSQKGDAYSDADSVSKWAVGAAKSTQKVQLAWYDMAFPYYTTPADLQKAGQEFADALPSGAIGRMYLSGTAAATWGAFDPNGLKKEYNKVQNYGDPIKGVMDLLNSWKK